MIDHFCNLSVSLLRAPVSVRLSVAVVVSAVVVGVSVVVGSGVLQYAMPMAMHAMMSMRFISVFFKVDDKRVNIQLLRQSDGIGVLS